MMLFTGANAAIIPDYTSTNPDQDGYIDYNGAVYARTSGAALAWCADGGATKDRGYIQWPTTTIPDNSTIISVSITISCTQSNSPDTWTFRQISAKPTTAADAALYADIVDGNLYHTYVMPMGTATRTFNLGNSTTDAACVDLQALLASDWFAVGIRSGAPVNWSSFVTEEGATDPLLTVRYSYMGYTYTFYGVYYENGTRATGLTSTVSIYSSDGTEDITVDNDYSGIAYGFTSQPVMFSYTIDSGAAVRNQYPTAATGNIYVFEPDDTYDAYEFTIKDYINALSGDVYLRSIRVINGTSYTIERMKVTDSITSVALQLTVGKVYSLEVTTSVGYTFDAGYFIPASDTTGSIALRWPTFTQQAQLTYRYVTVEATRPTITSIQVEANNTLAYTYNMTLIEVWINYRNGTNAYYVNSTTSPLAFTATWMGATNTTDYDVYVEITHGYFGVLKYEQSLSGASTWAAAPDFSVFGSVGGMDVSTLLPVLIIFVGGGLVSTLSIGLGAFTVAALAGTFTYIGWWTMSDTFLYTCLALAMLVIISERRNT